MLRRYSLNASPFGGTCSSSTSKSKAQTGLNHKMLPDSVLKKIGGHLPPLDRMRLQQTCRRFNNCFARWDDVVGIEVRCEEYAYCSEVVGASRTITTALQLPTMMMAAKKKANSKKTKSFHVRLIHANGVAFRLRTMDEKSAGKSMLAMLARQVALDELTLWDSCLSSEFTSILVKMDTVTTLRLWNCGRYFEKKTPSRRKLVGTLLGLPALKQLLILDSSANAGSLATCRRAVFSKSLAMQIRAPVENLQLTGVYLPLKTLEILSENLAGSCKRLAIGCTFGKESKRLLYLKALRNMKEVTDLDLPPFIFHLNEIPVADGVVQKLVNTLPLKALGFRHYNSSVLFRFIETQQLPVKVRILRVHHNANRIPNFAALGQTTPEDEAAQKISSAEKKTSVVSRYSILSTSRSSIGSLQNATTSNNGVDFSSTSPVTLTSPQAVIFPYSAFSNPSTSNKPTETQNSTGLRSASTATAYSNASYANTSSSTSGSASDSASCKYGSNASTLTTTVSTVANTQHEQKLSCTSEIGPSVQSPLSPQAKTIVTPMSSMATALAARRLTIFAVAEERTKRRTQRLRKRTYCGVDVIYSTESIASQEILGRMAAPMQSPHVYSKSVPSKCVGSGANSGSKRETKLRIIKGDLVKPIPLSSLGMESDYELSDWED
ncbi:hypothetical protein Ddc_13597 [Ditylenchus destructor]|nr:hypothetical protein Ddc_13597 [Ditylenchus destructor]